MAVVTRAEREAVSAAASALGKMRFAKRDHDEWMRQCANGGRASWAKMSPEERRLEMRRRNLQRKKNRMKKAKLLTSKG
jgi:hypothetical protein